MASAVALVADGVDADELARLTGNGKKSKFFYPNFSTNGKAAKAGIEEQLPIGVYMLQQSGKLAFAKTAIFRPFMHRLSYSIFDSSTKKYKSRSIYVESFFDEAFDTTGGLACGFVPSKVRKTLPEHQQKALKEIKMYRTWFGLLTMPDAVDVHGEPVILETVPVTYRCTGSNLMLLSDEVAKLEAKDLQFVNYNFAFQKPLRKENGDTVYYHPNIEVIPNPLPVTGPEFAAIQDFRGWIDGENEAVMKRYRESKAGIQTDAEDDSLGDDLQDAA